MLCHCPLSQLHGGLQLVSNPAIRPHQSGWPPGHDRGIGLHQQVWGPTLRQGAGDGDRAQQPGCVVGHQTPHTATTGRLLQWPLLLVLAQAPHDKLGHRGASGGAPPQAGLPDHRLL